MVMAVGQGGLVHAVTPSDTSLDSAPKERHPNGKATDAAQQDTRPVRQHGRPEARKAVEQHGKAQAGKTQQGTAQGAKGQSAAPDQKGHATAPVAVTPPAPAPPAEPPAKETGEPPPKIPRFAALKTDDTNMRKGPGQRYPIEWVYKRHDLPMEVEREYDVWRYVRDPDGVEGWVHQVTLSDRRTFIVRDKDATLRADAKDTASPVATLKVGVIGRLRECDEGSKWCQVQVSGYKGYLRRDQFWGLLPDEVVGPS
jgi:SH3-like domain-containing protein